MCIMHVCVTEGRNSCSLSVQNYTPGPILLTNRPGPFFPEWPARNFADRAIVEKMALSVKFREGHSGKNGPVSKI